MNDLCYAQDSVCLNSFNCVFVHKEVSCTNKTEKKTNYNKQTKKLSLPGDITVYTPKDLN